MQNESSRQNSCKVGLKGHQGVGIKYRNIEYSSFNKQISRNLDSIAHSSSSFTAFLISDNI